MIIWTRGLLFPQYQPNTFPRNPNKYINGTLNFFAKVLPDKAVVNPAEKFFLESEPKNKFISSFRSFFPRSLSPGTQNAA